MKKYVLLFFLVISCCLYAKEWKNLEVYQNTTQNEKLSPSDWLKFDRIQNTTVWQNANLYNLNNGLSQEYNSIIERTDFYKWLNNKIIEQGHDIVWIRMSYFISRKLHKMESFPYSINFTKETLHNVRKGSEVVFNNAFKDLKAILHSDKILKENDALAWDKTILFQEQYKWIDSIYKKMNQKSLKIFVRIAKGKFPYSLFVSKEIRFKGDISIPQERYEYAVRVLRPYCENTVK